MKQLVVEKNNPDPILLDTPIPKPGPGEVLIKNHYSVVSSGTELAAIEFANTGVSEKLQNSSNIEKGLKLLKDDGIRGLECGIPKKYITSSVRLQLFRRSCANWKRCKRFPYWR